MSFSQEIKKELLDVSFKNNCCKTAFLYGLLADAAVGQSGSLSATYGDESVAETVTRLLTARFHRDVNIMQRRFLGRTVYDVKMNAEAALKYITDGFPTNNVPSFFTCELCSRAFLSGLYLSIGHMADPGKEIHLYFSFRSAARASFVYAVLEKYCVAPKNIKRKNCTELYYKSSEDVTTLLTYLEVGKPLFDILNSQIEKEIRNQENRATNCDAKNIGRVVAACNRSTQLIMTLKASDAWITLPGPLKTTALLRVQNPDVSLAELGLLHVPPVSKSGVSHRLQKLDELAKSLK